MEDIAQEEEVFSIPHDVVLSASNSDFKTHITEDLDEIDPWLALVLVMIYESGKRESSRWWPYWRVLPSESNTLMYWSAAELAELQGSSVVSKIGKEAADEAFVEILLPLAIKYADLFGDYASDLRGAGAKEFFLPLAHRMATLIMAYAFDLERKEDQTPDENGFVPDDEENPAKGMVPLADMLNANGSRVNVCIYRELTNRDWI